MNRCEKCKAEYEHNQCTCSADENLKAIPASKTFTAKIKISKIIKANTLSINIGDDWTVACQEYFYNVYTKKYAVGVNECRMDLFKAGVEWQKDKDSKELNKIIEEINEACTVLLNVRHETHKREIAHEQIEVRAHTIKEISSYVMSMHQSRAPNYPTPAFISLAINSKFLMKSGVEK